VVVLNRMARDLINVGYQWDWVYYCKEDNRPQGNSALFTAFVHEDLCKLDWTQGERMDRKQEVIGSYHASAKEWINSPPNGVDCVEKKTVRVHRGEF